MPSCPSLAAQRPKPGDDEPRKKKRRNHARREREREDIFRATLVEVEVGIPSGRHRVRPRMERLEGHHGDRNRGGESAPPPHPPVNGANNSSLDIAHIVREGGAGGRGCMGAISSEAARASLALFSPSVAKLSCVASSAPQRGEGVFVWGGGGSSSYGWLWCKQGKRRRERGCGGDVDGAPRRRRRRRRREGWSRAALCHSPPQ